MLCCHKHTHNHMRNTIYVPDHYTVAVVVVVIIHIASIQNDTIWHTSHGPPVYVKQYFTSHLSSHLSVELLRSPLNDRDCKQKKQFCVLKLN